MKLSTEQRSRILHQKQKAEVCAEFYVSSYLEDSNTVYVKAHPLLCHSHYCDRCNKIRRASLYYSLVKWAKKRRLRFLTLTYSHDESPEAIIKRCSKDWNKFLLYLRRDGYTFNYFKVIEFTQADYVHFHFLVDVYVPQATLTRIWRDVTGHSYITWAEDEFGTGRMKKKGQLTNKDAINYLLKYVTKSFAGSQDYFAAFKLRRYSFSRYSYDFQKDRESFSSDYTFSTRIFSSVAEMKSHYRALYVTKFVKGFHEDYPEFVFL